eukprot:TRINITY_DN1979_c0_g3_i1.p1 TRINITY_DN1979_c0_g3~~TRINITY_DN1979_c0_g3_i1.p1  ORF type:complete len:277 (+),score=5.78 TRINITY_DN1979_c0_g3_i1:28-831(+)
MSSPKSTCHTSTLTPFSGYTGAVTPTSSGAIWIRFPEHLTTHRATQCVDEDFLLSYASYLDSIERSERSSPEREYAGCKVDILRELALAQPSDKRQRSVRKAMLNRESLMQSSKLGDLVAQFLNIFPQPARLHGELENFHPILRCRNDLERHALQAQSVADIRHCAMVVRTRGGWSPFPGEVNAVIAKFLAPGFGLLCMNRPSPTMWYEHVACRIDRRTRTLRHKCGQVRGVIFLRLLRAKFSEEQKMVLRTMFHSWRLSAQSMNTG